jgi:hypothetical protein
VADWPRRRLLDWGCLLIAAILLGYFAVRSWPTPAPIEALGPAPDTPDYIGGAMSLLRGAYVVDWDGPPRTPIYPPGFSLLLLPAVALGGPTASVWVPYIAALLLGLVSLFVAVRISSFIAAPLAVFFVLFASAPRDLALLVLTDLPQAALAVCIAALLMFGRGRPALLAAGVLSGALVWVRLASIPLLVAGVLALTARSDWRRAAAVYLTASMPLVFLLGLWQWATYGSPFTTGYQVVGAGPDGNGSFGSLFSVAYMLGPPAAVDGPVHGGAARIWELPNLVFYGLELLGADSFLSRPGVGALGLFALIVFARDTGARGVLGRFGLALTAGTLGVYVPYFYQSGRFLMAPAAILAIAAAAGVAVAAEALQARANRVASPAVTPPP